MPASCYGSAAAPAIGARRFGHIVAWHHDEVVTVPLERAVKEVRTVPPGHHLIGVARDLGISFAGDDD